MKVSKITDMMHTCIVLHNMIFKDKGMSISSNFYLEKQHRDNDPVLIHGETLKVVKEIHNQTTYLSLKAELMEHICHRKNNTNLSFYLNYYVMYFYY